MFTLRWWHVCMTDISGPGLSWIVLVAILGFGLVALGLLTAGPFALMGWAVGLAIGTVLIGMVRAASTARGAVARESELQAVTDALTGLGNRRHLLDQLTRRSPGRGAVGCGWRCR